MTPAEAMERLRAVKGCGAKTQWGWHLKADFWAAGDDRDEGDTIPPCPDCALLLYQAIAGPAQRAAYIAGRKTLVGESIATTEAHRKYPDNRGADEERPVLKETLGCGAECGLSRDGVENLYAHEYAIDFADECLNCRDILSSAISALSGGPR